MTLTVPIHHTQPQGRLTSLWQVVLLLLALWVWGLLAGGGMGIHTDISGSPLAATNAAGNVVWKENYSGYGERQLGTATVANQSQWFHGKEVDASTGLQYFGARYYDPAVGRFMGIDPVGFQEDNLHSFSRYAYGNNNPVKYLDPDGRMPAIAWAIFEAVAWLGARSAATVAVVEAGAVIANGAAGPGIAGLESMAVGAAKNAAKATTKGFVDLTGHRSAHILNRHRVGTGKFDKTEFPSRWSDKDILHHVSDVATDPRSTMGVGKWNSPYAVGTRDGVTIHVDFFPPSHPTHAGKISTAYPINVAPNP